MKIIPITLKQAKLFIEKYHRHNKGERRHRFSIGLTSDSGELIGIATAGNPKARLLNNGKTIEITRVCVKDGFRNTPSMLYGRIKRICQLMGYEKIITYTLKSESGASLRAIGAKIDGETHPHSWNTKSRPREEQEIYKQKKFRWIL